ncbi:pyridoxamine 5'-phosphate oxidase family protein [Alkalihalophilus lindianensis]|uniref:Pyridoxamine 5'-phosphate oxidase family protein n=1 Tax=Alkalihalophilus lindianensis TaxID=1630542 RepID=A0ABU3X9L3_9BACI|nr:pyridoxamine 5'-phosphate oxidase family protein [Alkalihalophilus lindianensis]MDV2684570.1 pyridoxamine 5'-phosphate oxidase family protein [Alkalihalophilus lindianensis]
MNQEELRNKILDVLKNQKIGTLATVKNNKPHSRYMSFFNEDFTLFTPTDKDTHKAEEIAENPNVHILLGYEGEGLGDKFVEVEGQATIRDSDELKKKIWSDSFSRWFEGPEDPSYIVLEIKPTMIRLMNAGEEPQVLEL